MNPDPESKPQGSEQQFNILNYDKLHSIPWRLVEPHRAQAVRNHGQTLERLHERGGLSPVELWHVVHGSDWKSNSITKESAYQWLHDFVTPLPNPSADEEVVQGIAEKWITVAGDAEMITDEHFKSAIREYATRLSQQHNAEREEVQAFIKHVGFPTFKECVDVMLRTKAQDEDKIEGMFNKLKEQGKELQQLRASLAEKDKEIQELRKSLEAEIAERDYLRTQLGGEFK